MLAISGATSGIASGARRVTFARVRPAPLSLVILVLAMAWSSVDLEPGPLEETEATIVRPPTASMAEMIKDLESLAAVVPLVNRWFQE